MAIQTVKTGAAVNDGTGDDARTAFTKINQNFTDSANAASRLVGTGKGNTMEVGAFGLGGISPITTSLTNAAGGFSSWLNAEPGDSSGAPSYQMALNMPWVDDGNSFQLLVGLRHTRELGYRRWARGSGFNPYQKIRTTENTTVDSNGFIKAASPIVSVYADNIELNEEAKLQPITFEKLGVGDYLIKGSTGFAQEGWYIETPKDANGNLIVAVVYEQLANNDISVKTYDYMLNKKGRIVPDLKTPLDIPSTRWIDLRLQELPQDDIQPLSEDETVNTNAE